VNIVDLAKFPNQTLVQFSKAITNMENLKKLKLDMKMKDSVGFSQESFIKFKRSCFPSRSGLKCLVSILT